MFDLKCITAIRILAPFGLFMLFGMMSPSLLRADAELEITPPPIVVTAEELSKLTSSDRDKQSQAAARAWASQYGPDLRLVYASVPSSGAEALNHTAPTRVSALGAAGDDALNKLVIQVVQFANNVSSFSTSFAENFHAQFMHAISESAPGFAWVVMAERSGFDLDWMDGYRIGGGLGVQIPVLGSKDLWVKDDHGQVVLRVMPIAGNYEAIEVGKNNLDRVAAPGSNIVLRPTAEIEATYQLQRGIQPGMRFLVQPRLMAPSQVRMVAEVYVSFDIKVSGSMIKQVSVLPRCMIDYSNDREFATVPSSDLYREGNRFLNREATCSLSAQFTFQQ